MSGRYKLHPHWTAKRQAWLEILEKTPGINRAGIGVVGCHCMRLGWTKWTENCDGEVLTDEGRDKLNEWRGRLAHLAEPITIIHRKVERSGTLSGGITCYPLHGDSYARKNW